MTRPWTATVLTILPDMFPGPLDASLIGQALSEAIWALDVIDIREFATDKHRSVDDTPAGGGAGMVMRADVAGPALEAAIARAGDAPRLCLSPRGRPFDQAGARRLAEAHGAIFLCGRFEGLDERVIDEYELAEVSLGDFVLAGGEVAAMAMIEATVRLLPGVAGNAASLADESFETGLLEYPHYTRPRDWRGRAIPDVLLSGDHGRIKAWRRDRAEALTRARRPDLRAKREPKD